MQYQFSCRTNMPKNGATAWTVCLFPSFSSFAFSHFCLILLERKNIQASCLLSSTCPADLVTTLRVLATTVRATTTTRPVEPTLAPVRPIIVSCHNESNWYLFILPENLTFLPFSRLQQQWLLLLLERQRLYLLQHWKRLLSLHLVRRKRSWIYGKEVSTLSIPRILRVSGTVRVWQCEKRTCIRTIRCMIG